MGQMTYAILYGCKMKRAPKSMGDDGWYTLIEEYKARRGPKPDVDYNDEHRAQFMGFWVAAGASGKDGIPTLGTMPLDGMLSIGAYKKAHERAVDAWVDFAKWAHETKSIDIGAPALWLVQTEVA